jgi:hypothetical protein
MKYLIKIISAITLFALSLFAQEERKVLVEVFTNSHCPLCPAAHNVIDNYLAGPNGEKISYIYYHMVYPYPDDLLYQQSMEGSDARDNYYNPVSATPQGWFDGTHQGSTSGWAASLDNLVNTQSPLKITLSGTRDPENFYISAELTRTGSIPDNDLVIHFVVAEDLFYDGRNSVSDHKHVMRKMFPTPDGQSFSINLNETKNIPQTIPLDPIWDADSLNVVVFVQSTGSMTVYQSETIAYNELNVSEVDDKNLSLNNFSLDQNYPNPFNPSTKIKWSSPTSGYQTLKIYNVLGNEVATLVDEYKSAGEYEINFNASGLPSGIYFYTLTAGNFKESKKMTVLK